MIIERVAAQAIDTMVAQEVALLADSQAECRLQMTWIYDCQVPPVDQLLPARVQFPGTVATLAADRVALKYRLLESVNRVVDRLDCSPRPDHCYGRCRRLGPRMDDNACR